MSDRTYIFDAYAGRAIVANDDGEVPLGLDRLHGLLDHLAERGERALLRAFLLACVDRLPTYGSDQAALFVDAARRGDAEALAQLRHDYTHVSMAAGAIGLRRGARNAATYLAAFAATDPDIRKGAAYAAQMERLHAEMSANDSDVPLPAVVTQTQIDWLLDRLPTE